MEAAGGPSSTVLEAVSPSDLISCTTGGKRIYGGPDSECCEPADLESGFGPWTHSKLGDVIINTK